ncbi:hypothetical protein [Ornithinimicrobium sp. INDO-MA30-4]|uniref:hypothetical protein n=1 Tax=Ornithinimicrobium sp. INDO-MA30-4 TaxID=2908651 RepID=UPI001F343536|nr:hypothetical protein [Ornithinimicrobium sp. INDO-MA30-4]UJH71701.1 hypothetical protein L0A91_10125 [Ornithinimicrobium sp. INDO-MA30-4]
MTQTSKPEELADVIVWENVEIPCLMGPCWRHEYGYQSRPCAAPFPRSSSTFPTANATAQQSATN